MEKKSEWILGQLPVQATTVRLPLCTPLIYASAAKAGQKAAPTYPHPQTDRFGLAHKVFEKSLGQHSKMKRFHIFRMPMESGSFVGASTANHSALLKPAAPQKAGIHLHDVLPHLTVPHIRLYWTPFLDFQALSVTRGQQHSGQMSPQNPHSSHAQLECWKVGTELTVEWCGAL